MLFFLNVVFFMKCGSVNCPKFWINNVGNWTNSSRIKFISTSMHQISTNHSQSTTDVDHKNYKISTNLCLQKVVQNKVYGEVKWCKEFCVCVSCGTIIVIGAHHTKSLDMRFFFGCWTIFKKCESQLLQIFCSCHVAPLLSWLYLF